MSGRRVTTVVFLLAAVAAVGTAALSTGWLTGQVGGLGRVEVGLRSVELCASGILCAQVPLRRITSRRPGPVVFSVIAAVTMIVSLLAALLLLAAAVGLAFLGPTEGRKAGR